MNSNRPELKSRHLHLAGSMLFQAAVLALGLTMALPASAADVRPVKSRVQPVYPVRVMPVYPELAKQVKLSGLVTVKVNVDPNGKVTGVTPISGNRILLSAAESAVRCWKFKPGDGPTTLVVPFNFGFPQ